MSTRQGNIKDYQGNKIAPNTDTQAVLDSAKNQALSQTLLDTPDRNALGYEPFSTVLNYPVGKVVYYQNKLWIFTSAHTAGAWNSDHVTEYPIKEMIDFLEKALGKYSSVGSTTLSQAIAGKYINTSGAAVAQSGFGISAPITLNFGDILLVPSAEAVPAAVSVVSRVVTRTYAKVITYTYTYQQENPELYDTATADYDSSLVYTAVYDTSGETPVLTGWTIGGETLETLPATREVTESYYEPLVKQAVAAMPSTGYYVYLCPQSMTVVISGLTATVNGGVCQTVGLGIFKNIVSNFLSMPGQNAVAQALCDLNERLAGISRRFDAMGKVGAEEINLGTLPKVGGSEIVITGTGAPAVVPHFIGQQYIDLTNRKVYSATKLTPATTDWTLLN